MENIETQHHEDHVEHDDASASILDSKTKFLDDALNEKLEEAFDQTSDIVLHDVAKIASQHDPIDMAHAVSRLPPQARVIVYENLPDFNAKIIFMINTSSSTRTAIFREIDDNEIRQLIDKMPPDEVVWILDDMTDRRMKRIFERLDPKKAMRIKELQKHDRHSAGRLMTDEFFAFHMNTTIGDVSSFIRNNPGIELTRRIFVLDDDNQLAGYVPNRNLIINPDYLSLRHVMRPVLHKVTADTSRDEVIDLVERYKIHALPVINENDRMIGVITYESVVEAIEDIADETIANIAGTAEDYNEYESTWKRFKGRAPWLMVTLFAGLVSTSVMTYFYDRVWFVFLPFFLPLITGMSGNVGIQCSTVLVRGMSTGDISSGSKREAISREIGIGILIGIIFGFLCGVVVYLMNYLGIHQLATDHVALGVTVMCGVFGACLTATLLGTFSPFFFARFGVDPAVASGPIVNAFNDVLSTLIFFLVARLVYVLFLPEMMMR
jgi:magnesium transporter